MRTRKNSGVIQYNCEDLMKIFIYGPPGSGKSTIGKILASNVNAHFLDLDAEIELYAGDTISSIFKTKGEVFFRDLETKLLEGLDACDNTIIALGGGTLLRSSNRSVVEKMGIIICLDATVDTLLSRLDKNAETRPLIAENVNRNLHKLITERASHYHSFPIIIDSSIASPEDIAWEIQKKLGVFHVKGMGKGYFVRVVNGGLSNIGYELKKMDVGGPIALVSDENVGRIYGDIVATSLSIHGFDVHRIDIIPGEAHKNIETVSGLWEKFLFHGLERKSTVVALGGGVVGDLAGFAAATYLRGIPWVNIPTSLLAMVDAGIGGKTGADLPQGKNLIGAFHAPLYVLADPETLSTLPTCQMRNGLGEVIKHGLIDDFQLFKLCESGWDRIQSVWDEIVRRAIAVKIKIIEADPFERGLRQVLNLGHTIGHAIETASDYQLFHGEAVAIGMAIETSIAEELGIAEKGLTNNVLMVLKGVGLPTDIPDNINRSAVINAIKVDKKRMNGKIHFPLPVRVGECHVGVEIENIEHYI